MNETKAKIKAVAIIFFCLYALASCFANTVQAEDGIRDRSPSRGLGDVYKRQLTVRTVDVVHFSPMTKLLKLRMI